MFTGEGTLTQFDEPIEITVEFQSERPCIRKFVLQWRGQRYSITCVHLYHQDWHGEALIHYFSVTAGGKFFKLRFDSKKLQWFLEEIFEPH